MGFFSKHKEEKSNVGGIVAPPLPNMVSNTLSKVDENNNVPSNVDEVLMSPPMPGSGFGLDDIKSQVTGVNDSNYNKPILDSSEDLENHLDNDDNESNLTLDDSLFDFSEIDDDNLNMSHEVPKIQNFNHENTIVKNSNVNQNVEEKQNLSFLENSKNFLTSSNDETYFVTTAQFKTLLEIVDSVKERVKNSTDSHLRLLDIKSEEDIEYENLKKDFQFIENKLYELDGIIFEK